jgi:hypothetical protein
MNDLRVCERLARPQSGLEPAATSENALPLFSGGQVVAGSNPVSPTERNSSSRPVSEKSGAALFQSFGNTATSSIDQFDQFDQPGGVGRMDPM